MWELLLGFYYCVAIRLCWCKWNGRVDSVLVKLFWSSEEDGETDGIYIKELMGLISMYFNLTATLWIDFIEFLSLQSTSNSTEHLLYAEALTTDAWLAFLSEKVFTFIISLVELYQISQQK